MNFTQHTAMKAAEQMQAGVKPDDIDPTELMNYKIMEKQNEHLRKISRSKDTISQTDLEEVGAEYLSGLQLF